MDGRGASKRIRAPNAARHPPAREAGASEVLIKPCVPADLLARAKDLLAEA